MRNKRAPIHPVDPVRTPSPTQERRRCGNAGMAEHPKGAGTGRGALPRARQSEDHLEHLDPVMIAATRPGGGGSSRPGPRVGIRDAAHRSTRASMPAGMAPGPVRTVVVRRNGSPPPQGLDSILSRFAPGARHEPPGSPPPRISRCRRAFLVGRGPARVVEAGDGGLKSSYSSRASGAGPRRAGRATIRTTRTLRPWTKVRTSPMQTAVAGFETFAPLTRTRAADTVFAARPRGTCDRRIDWTSGCGGRGFSGRALPPCARSAPGMCASMETKPTNRRGR